MGLVSLCDALSSYLFANTTLLPLFSDNQSEGVQTVNSALNMVSGLICLDLFPCEALLCRPSEATKVKITFVIPCEVG